MYINKVLLYGNLTRDPEIRALPSGGKVASFGLATNRTWKDKNGAKQESVEFHNIVMFGVQADLAAQYLRKGKPIFVDGRIQTRSWDGQDGKKQYRTEIVVENFQFGPQAPGQGGQGQGGSYSSAAAPQTAKTSPAASPKTKEKEGDAIQYPGEEVNLEDIPF